MNNSIKAIVLDQLNQAFHNNELAIKRGPRGNSISKEHMLETRVYLANAMRIIEQGDESLNTDPENAVWLLNELASTDDITCNELDVRFEVDGRDTGCDVEIQGIADLALTYIHQLESQINPKDGE